MVCAAAVALTLYGIFERRFATEVKLGVIGIASVVTLSTVVVPVGAGLQQEPIKEAARLCRERGIEPIMWRLNAPSFSVYRGQPTATREPVRGDVVLTKAKRLSELPGLGYEVLYAKNGIVLIRIKA